jgi:prepilin-type processing-associated H-X9-DG protein
LEQDTLYRRLDLHRESFEYPNAEVAGVTLPVFQCPSTENPRLADYRIIGIDVPNPLGTTDYVPTAAVLPHLVSANPPRTALYGLMENLVNVHTSEVTDGLSNTIAFTEDAGRPQYWRQGTRVPNREPLPSSAWVDPLNAIFVGGAKSDPNLIVNFVNSDEIYSFHPAGANAVMADGSVRLLSVRASPRLVVALITRAGGESVPPD